MEPIALQYVAVTALPVTVNLRNTLLHFGSAVIMLLFVLQLCV